MAKDRFEVSRCAISRGAILVAAVRLDERGEVDGDTHFYLTATRDRAAPIEIELNEVESAILLKMEEIGLRRDELAAAERARAEQRDNYRRDSERVQWRP